MPADYDLFLYLWKILLHNTDQSGIQLQPQRLWSFSWSTHLQGFSVNELFQKTVKPTTILPDQQLTQKSDFMFDALKWANT